LPKLRETLLKKEGAYQELFNELSLREDVQLEEIDFYLEAIIDFIKVDNLRLKLFRELGSEFPFELKRINPKGKQFESWYPLGVLVHFTPSNSPLLSVAGVIEGLLSGNINILKLGRKMEPLPVYFFKTL